MLLFQGFCICCSLYQKAFLPKYLCGLLLIPPSYLNVAYSTKPLLTEEQNPHDDRPLSCFLVLCSLSHHLIIYIYFLYVSYWSPLNVSPMRVETFLFYFTGISPTNTIVLWTDTQNICQVNIQVNNNKYHLLSNYYMPVIMGILLFGQERLCWVSNI